ncbi:MAG TPA: 2'-5' RNA ligase family protein [Anaerolineales bacterium]|nr:2'-5' RNA ligase family protein [Anaerolineales bacterium]
MTEIAKLQVQAVVALVDEPYTERVKGIWNLLQAQCGLKAVNLAPFPHFTFHGARQYDLDDMDKRLTELANTLPPFTVRTTGLGIFTGAVPVLYIPLVSDQTLLDVHQTVWSQTSVLGEELNEHYWPGIWVPHITLAIHDVTAENIDCAVKTLADHDFSWEITVHRLAVVCLEGGVAGIHRIYSLSG